MSGFDLGKGLAAITMNLMNKNQNGTSNNIGNEFGTGVDEFGFGFSSEAAAAKQVSPSSGSSGGIGGLEGLFRSWTPPVQFGMQEGGSIGDMNLNQIAEIYVNARGLYDDEQMKWQEGFEPNRTSDALQSSYDAGVRLLREQLTKGGISEDEFNSRIAALKKQLGIK